ncbi:S-layer homology domain-containing protein [Paenibacillus athensensis]|nr:S-layer homology domain-containing protein [Paenibacillus athensensis]MCD1259429.1 S-layer homology domain-containing protein [Paenibacillus athensensis]
MRTQPLYVRMLTLFGVLLLIVQGGLPVVTQAAVTYGVTTLAGTGISGYNGDGGSATGAKLNTPSGVAVDGNGNIYIADTENHRVRKVDSSTGNISTIAGTGVSGYNGDGITATTAQLYSPTEVILDGDGNVYIADTNNNRVRKIGSDGKISTVAGTGVGGYDGDGGQATTKQLNGPSGLALDSSGNLYIADTYNHRVRMVNASGTISTVAGTGSNGFSGDGNAATAAKLDNPYKVVLGVGGVFYIVDSGNQCLRKVGADGKISTIAGGNGNSGEGVPANTSWLSLPSGAAADSNGDVYVSDTLNNRVRKIDAATGNIYTINDSFNNPYGLAVDSSGSIYVADTYNHQIRKLTILSSNAGLTCVLGQTDNAPGGGGGSTAGSAVTWSVNVPNAQTEVGLSSVTAATYASFKLYTNSAFSAEVTGSTTVPLPDGGATTVYVKVTAQDNVTVNYYAVTVNRAASISSDAGLTSVLGQADNAPGGGDGSAAGSAKTWSVNVLNPQATAGRADLAAAADATFKLYADSDFTTEVTGSGTIPLTAGAATGIYVQVTAQDGVTVRYYAVTVNRAPTPSSDAGLTGVAGQTDHAPGGGDGSLAMNAATWTVNVPYSQPELGLAHLAAAADATFKLFSDSAYTAEITGSGTIPLTAGRATVAYVQVTAQDGVTVKHYAVTVNRGPAPSSDAGLTSVLGRADKAPGGGDGSAAGNAYTWSVKVANVQAKLAATQITAASGATFKLYSDSDITAEVTDGGTIALKAGGATVVYVQVTAEDGVTVRYYAITIHRDRSSSSADTGTVVTPVESSHDSEGIDIYVNGKAEKTGTATTTVVDGRTVTTIELDQQKITDKLTAEGRHALVTIVSGKGSDVARARVSSEILQKMKDFDATLEFKTAYASYQLPAHELNGLTAGNGGDAELQGTELQVEIAASPESKRKQVEEAAQAGRFTLAAPPVDFSVSWVDHQGQAFEITSFTQYVERTIAIPDGVDPNQITTAVVAEPDGTIRHVPTQVEVVDGAYVARIHSLTNSTYALVWHPLEFRDAAGHWAHATVNDLGARMIALGDEQGLFRPDHAVTRAEFAATLVRGLGLKLVQSQTPAFTDVSPADWSYAAVQTAYAYHLISGFEDGAFRPSATLTREQAMVMLARAMQLTGGFAVDWDSLQAGQLLSPFTDADELSSWAADSVARVMQAELVVGRSQTTLAPQAVITRAEAAVIVQRLLQKAELI